MANYKGKYIIASSLVLIILLLAGCSFSNNSKGETGIDVLGPEDGYRFEIEFGQQIVYVLEDGMTVTGLAQTDTKIQIADGVNDITIKNLQQNDYSIEIYTSNYVDSCTLNFLGSNTIYAIESPDSVFLKGGSDDNELFVETGISSRYDMIISNLTLTATYLYSKGHMHLLGNSQIHLNDTIPYGSDRLDRIEVCENLYVDLEEKGFVDLGECIGLPIVCYGSIDLGDQTVIAFPEGALINKYYEQFEIQMPDGSNPGKVVLECVQ